jgi:hypothetical protein
LMPDEASTEVLLEEYFVGILQCAGEYFNE